MMDDMQMEYAQSTQDVDYFLGHMEVLFSPVVKHRFGNISTSLCPSIILLTFDMLVSLEIIILFRRWLWLHLGISKWHKG